MGLRVAYLQFISEVVAAAGFAEIKGLRMCELGNQRIRRKEVPFTSAKTGKEYFTSLGYLHTSIDWNGEDGAIPLDLRKPITDPALVGQFDVLTNSGTTEHVEDQWECFKNLHALVKDGGVFAHLNPKTGSWPGHGLFYYTFEFYRGLADVCRYDKLTERKIDGGGERTELVCVGLRKRSDSRFPEREAFASLARETLHSA